GPARVFFRGAAIVAPAMAKYPASDGVPQFPDPVVPGVGYRARVRARGMHGLWTVRRLSGVSLWLLRRLLRLRLSAGLRLSGLRLCARVLRVSLRFRCRATLSPPR